MSPMDTNQTPTPHSVHITTDQVQQLLDMLNKVQRLSTPSTEAMPPGDDEQKQGDGYQPKLRASKVDITRVYEFWNKSTYKYEIKKSFDTVLEEGDEYTEYIAVFRQKFDSEDTLLDSFIDVKSTTLRDILRDVLDGVTCVSLREDKPSINPDVLFTYETQLEAFQTTTTPGSPERLHLSKLIEFLKTHYASTRDKLTALVQHKEITFNLLPVFFRPNCVIYVIPSTSENSRCVIFNSGKFQIDHGKKHFEMICRYLTHDGKRFGEATIPLKIPEFDGIKKITLLGAYPLEYHPQKQDVVEQLTERGRKFCSLIGTHFRQYEGQAFYMDKKEVKKFSVSGRVMVDAVSFRKKNPNYSFPRLDVKSSKGRQWLWDSDSEDDSADDSSETSREVKDQKIPCSVEDLLVCSETVYAFSFQRKRWGELCVDDIEEIDWDCSAFDTLVIPTGQKEIIQSLVERHTNGSDDEKFDDIIQGKGQNIVLLLHGPPGVGKTLTAEGLAEKRKLPLYSVYAGDLGTNAERLEENLLEITSLAHKWRAIILIDESDVYLAERSLQDVQWNALVSVFLRHLEYFQGIMFLTTNRVATFDAAFQSRIHFSIRFGDLGRDVKKNIWKTFLGKVKVEVNISEKEIDSLSDKTINGRQIKNFARTGMEFALWKNEPLSIKHLEIAIEAGEAFEVDHKGYGPIESLRNYM
ncbi:uncharacterized protein PV06_11009 [Exophiala oligosperma]|uniref:AAA+ ATPase domain-containing protein n=1 Tax=Exophiala oligosperma TaxID=215243 RepID=A0A0D2D3M1_9EURO|nr:uncharacterized protein PV06_11009 [Exophiala oligosperma]KIW36895.1 hypothetical protein PV06_11009 [Exophiala oligosperma]